MVGHITLHHVFSWTFFALAVLSAFGGWMNWLGGLHATVFAFGFFILGELCSIHTLLLKQDADEERQQDRKGPLHRKKGPLQEI